MKSIHTITAAALLSLSACSGGDQPVEPTMKTSAASTAEGIAQRRYRREVITRGADIHATNGVKFGPDGLLYIASVLERAVVAIDPRSGHRVRTLGNDVGVETPDDLTFGPDGSLYWTSFLTGEVGRLTPAGEKRTVAQLGPGVNPIAFSPDGRLFVGHVFLGDDLYELDPDGVAAPRLVAANLGGLNSMEFGPDGKIYAPLWFRGQVVRVDPDTGAVEVLASGIGTPASVQFNAAGELFTIDQLRGEFLRVDISTGHLTVVADGIVGGDDAAFDARGHAFISNSHDGSIHEVLPNGRKRVVLPGGVAAPGGIAVLNDSGKDKLFVADVLSIKELDPRRHRVTDEIFGVIGVTALATPMNVTADGDNLIVSSWFANTVQVLAPSTQTVLESHSDFAVPLDALRFGGDLVVTELGTGSVVRKNASGIKSTLASGLVVPTGLAATTSDLYVTEWATGRVLRLVSNGLVETPPRVVASGLSGPEGIAVDVDGSLLVVEAGLGRLVRVDPGTGVVSVVESRLNPGLPGVQGMPPTHLFNDVTVGRDGTIYVTQDATNEVLALRR